MKQADNKRIRWLHLRLTPDEYARLQQQYRKTTCRKLSDYSRKILLGKPITVYQRNQSLDDFMAEMMLLRNELSSLGNSFHQAVKKLHTLSQTAELKSWLMTYELDRQILLHKVDEIKNRINKIADQWLQ
jgi:hypothetical protein